MSMRVSASSAPSGSSSGEEARAADQGAGERDALPLAAGQGGGPVPRLVGKADLRRAPPRARIRRSARRSARPRPTATLSTTRAQGSRRGSWNIIRAGVAAAGLAAEPDAPGARRRRGRRSGAAACSCRSRCGRRWRRTGRPGCAGRGRAARAVSPNALARPREVTATPARPRAWRRASPLAMASAAERHGSRTHLTRPVGGVPGEARASSARATRRRACRAARR